MGIQLSMDAVIFGVTSNDGNLALPFLPLSPVLLLLLPSSLIVADDMVSSEPLRSTAPLRPAGLLSSTPSVKESATDAMVVFGNGDSAGNARLSNCR